MIPEAIFIDFNGTLSHSLFWEHLKDSDLKEDRDMFAACVDALFTNRKDEIYSWMRGGSSTEKELKFVANKAKQDYNQILKEFIKGCELMELASENLKETILELRKKGVKVVISTNNMDCFSRWTVPAMNLKSQFDDILNSFDRKGMKHDNDESGETIFFRGFFQKNNLNPSKCLFIDDGLDKQDRISNLGIKYIQIHERNGLEKELLKVRDLLQI